MGYQSRSLGDMEMDMELNPTEFELKVPWWMTLRSIILGPILVPIR